MPKLVLALPSPSGRMAIMARKDEKHPWVQVESILGQDNARKYIEELQEDDQERYSTIEANGDEEWDKASSPTVPPLDVY